MSFKVIFELGAFAFGFQRGSIKPVTFTILSLYILLNSAIIPPILRHIYDPSRVYAGYEKQNMLHMKQNAELRILSCIYRTDDIRPMINLLEATCPSRENHVATYVLHLMELVGKAHPLQENWPQTDGQIRRKSVGMGEFRRICPSGLSRRNWKIRRKAVACSDGFPTES
ncbi:Cation/H(+) antiporter 4 [Cardamine amara subsp. amara]|uniref:Cation/H(+) antiporter 4 n=1 Tax=Cardamine amara subsp. amara TaxID=228776 RepID=A0ABD1BIM4_CARAN